MGFQERMIHNKNDFEWLQLYKDENFKNLIGSVIQMKGNKEDFITVINNSTFVSNLGRGIQLEESGILYCKGCQFSDEIEQLSPMEKLAENY